jgi:hypothetical protein
MVFITLETTRTHGAGRGDYAAFYIAPDLRLRKKHSRRWARGTKGEGRRERRSDPGSEAW